MECIRLENSTYTPLEVTKIYRATVFDSSYILWGAAKRILLTKQSCLWSCVSPYHPGGSSFFLLELSFDCFIPKKVVYESDFALF